MIVCDEFLNDDLLKINNAAKLYSKVPRRMKKLVLHAYNLGFADGCTSKEEIKMVRDSIIREAGKEELSYD